MDTTFYYPFYKYLWISNATHTQVQTRTQIIPNRIFTSDMHCHLYLQSGGVAFFLLSMPAAVSSLFFSFLSGAATAFSFFLSGTTVAQLRRAFLLAAARQHCFFSSLHAGGSLISSFLLISELSSSSLVFSLLVAQRQTKLFFSARFRN
jgi:hypothetical protein